VSSVPIDQVAFHSVLTCVFLIIPVAAAEGIYTSILTGLLVGFLYPILPWFFFREIPAPNFFEPLEVEHDRTGSSTTTAGSSGRTGEVLEEQLDWSMGILPNATGSTGSGSTGANAGGRAGGRSGSSETAPGNPGTRGLFGLRGRPGGEWVTGVVFGQRVQVGSAPLIRRSERKTPADMDCCTVTTDGYLDRDRLEHRVWCIQIPCLRISKVNSNRLIADHDVGIGLYDYAEFETHIEYHDRCFLCALSHYGLGLAHRE